MIASVDRVRPFAAPLTVCEGYSCVRAGEQVRVTATGVIRRDAPYLAGHFPGLTIFPGVFVVEAVRQAVAHAAGECDGRLPELRALRSVRFLAPLFPGDRLAIDAVVALPGPGLPIDVTADCRSAGRLVARFSGRFGWST